MPLDLVIPYLALPGDAPPGLRSARLPAAEKWLARADTCEEPAASALEWIAREHGIGPPYSFAAISLRGEGREETGEWLRADPVHLRIENDDLVLHDASILNLTLDEARSLAAALGSHFAPDGLAVEAISRERWYVRIPPGAPPATVPLERAFGRNVFGLLPKGTGSFNWATALTEAQMVLSSHEVNAAREPGRPAVNSVWFWGEGATPAAVERRYETIYADEPYARGIARLSGASARDMPASLAAIETPRAGASALALIDAGLGDALRRGDVEAWLGAARSLERGWFEDLAPALARFGTVRVILPGEKRTRLASITAASRWRWLRARKPVASLG